MNDTTYRLGPQQKRRQWISGALFLAGSAYLLHPVLSEPANERAVLVGGLFGPLMAVIGTAHLLALRTSVSFDECELRWSAVWSRRKRFAWSDITKVEVVKKSERANAPEIVQVTHRARGVYDLPVLMGLQGSWRDPAFEARTAELVAAWRAAAAAAVAQ
ncbi:hypothetical protein [Kitasatospora sp. NPDC090091]|uniref:hypothetical protein n=1 Tax=Kitasatospora sp. NPDC090091 TaxID=3364081 RepID=UPI00382CD858